MYAVKKPNEEVTYNKNEIIEVIEDFYRELYHSNDQPRMETNTTIRDIPNIMVEEVNTALKGMKREKTPGEDGIRVDLVQGAGEIATVKLANLFNRCLSVDKTPKSGTNAIIISIHKKGEHKRLIPLKTLITYRDKHNNWRRSKHYGRGSK